jgi:hypothetical protein
MRARAKRSKPGVMTPEEDLAPKENGSHPAYEIAPELTGHGLPLSKCEAYNRVYEQPYESR